METFTLKVIGFSRVFYEGEAVQVQLPIQDGSMGIMAHHESSALCRGRCGCKRRTASGNPP
jgi:F0F1-type ATP synthase epsilon subunit